MSTGVERTLLLFAGAPQDLASMSIELPMILVASAEGCVPSTKLFQSDLGFTDPSTDEDRAHWDRCCNDQLELEHSRWRWQERSSGSHHDDQEGRENQTYNADADPEKRGVTRQQIRRLIGNMRPVPIARAALSGGQVTTKGIRRWRRLGS